MLKLKHLVAAAALLWAGAASAQQTLEIKIGAAYATDTPPPSSASSAASSPSTAWTRS
jgi:hypothetical protein